MLWIQSELLAAMLDLNIREATNGRRSLDDLMRALYSGFSGPPGFTTDDIERLATQVSGRNLRPFFDAYLRRAGRIEINRFLGLAGLRMDVKTAKANAPDGALRPDARVYAMLLSGEDHLRLYLTHPESAWLRADVRNGDQFRSMNGVVVETEGDFNDRLNACHDGNKVKVEVMRAGEPLEIAVDIESYDWPKVKISQVPTGSDCQKAIFAAWQASQ